MPRVKLGTPTPAQQRAVMNKIIKKAMVDCDIEDYPGIVLTVNGTAVRSLCLNVRVMLGEDTTTSTLDLEVG